MLKGIDISNWQDGEGFDLLTVIKRNELDFVVVKATEGCAFVDTTCDRWVQTCIDNDTLWGFYHFARTNGGAREARYFYNQTRNYVGKGIPVLDFEDKRNDNHYIDEFVREYHAITGVYPWVYMNSDFINNRGYGSDYVRRNCGLWLAGYPSRATMYPTVKTCPYKHKGWTLAAWQFTDNLSIGGMHVDGDIFYGDSIAWNMYAKGDAKPATTENKDTSTDLSSAIDVMAKAVIAGKFGNGQQRKDNIYNIIQKRVNELV